MRWERERERNKKRERERKRRENIQTIIGVEPLMTATGYMYEIQIRLVNGVDGRPVV